MLRSAALASGRIASALTAASLLSDPKAPAPEKGSSVWLECELLGEGLPVTLGSVLARPDLSPLLPLLADISGQSLAEDSLPGAAPSSLSEADMKVLRGVSCACDSCACQPCFVYS